MTFIREYTVPLLLAMLLHAAAAWSLYQGWSPDRDTLNVIKPRTVMANLMVLEPQARPAPPPPKPVTRTQPQADKPTVDPAAERRKQEQDAARKAKAEAEEQARKQAELDRQRAERLQRLSELAQTSLDQAIQEESANLQSGTEEMVAQSYRMGIYELVRQNWSRPPSARNGMSAKLLVELIPTGEVVGVNIVEGSGNAAFDRSAEQAVRRARRFEVPQENAIFERHFRRFYFLFQPEDLLR